MPSLSGFKNQEIKRTKKKQKKALLSHRSLIFWKKDLVTMDTNDFEDAQISR